MAKYHMLIYPHILDNTIESDYPRDYLNPFVNSSHLLLTDNKLAYSLQWYKEFIQTNKIQRVLIDATHNPVEYKNGNLQSKYSFIKNICPTTVLVNDFTLPQGLYYDIKLFPVFLYLYSLRDSAWHKNIIFDIDSGTKKYPMGCLNRNPSWHRVYLFTQLANQEILSKIKYTFGTHSPALMKYQTNQLSVEEQQLFDQYKHLLPLVVDNLDYDSTNDVGISHSTFRDCAFNLVTETTVECPFVSEKTCKAIIAEQIPIIVGAPGVTKYLSDLGLDMFDDVVNWSSWDYIQDHRTRMDAIVAGVKKLLNKNLVMIHKNLLSRIQANKQYFHSEQFRQKLIQL